MFAHDHARSLLKEVQDRLFTVGSSLACDPDKEPLMKIPDLKEEDITLLEREIDAMNEVLVPMKSFIIPGGDVAVSHAHVARCICRRTERLVVNLLLNDEENENLIIKYINRLSDYLFTLSRYTSKQLNAEEIPWTPRVS